MPEPAPVSTAPSVWNLPNALTILRIVLVPVFVVLLLQDTVGARIGAGLVFVLAALTDRWDGHLARTRGLITKFGTMADTIADKVLVGAALIALSMLVEVPWWVTIVLLLREASITVLKVGLSRRHLMAPSRGGKLKAVLQMVALSILVFDWPNMLPDPFGLIMYWLGIVVLYAATVVAVASAIDYFIKGAAVLRKPA